jgi:hypothetical protein
MEGITTLLKVVLIGFGLRVLINDLNWPIKMWCDGVNL